MKKLIKILIGLGIFVSIVIVLAYALTLAPVRVAKSQLKLISSGNFQKAYGLTSEDFQKNTSFSSFENFINKSSLKKAKKISFTSRQIKNNVAYLEGKLVFTDGTTVPIMYKLIREEGEWRILSIKIK